MKMEHSIASDVDGTVEAISVSVGDQVKAKQLVATVTPDPSDESEQG